MKRNNEIGEKFFGIICECFATNLLFDNLIKIREKSKIAPYNKKQKKEGKMDKL